MLKLLNIKKLKYQLLDNLMLEFRNNNFLKCCAISVSLAAKLFPRNIVTLTIMYYERRQDFGKFLRYPFMLHWRAHTLTYQPHILVLQVPPWMNKLLSAHGPNASGVKHFKESDSRVVTKRRNYERRKAFLESTKCMSFDVRR